MKTKILLLITMMLPIAAHADYTFVTVDTPAGVGRNGVVTRASSSDSYYQISDITSADEGHIATTAYVKGAYNDTIAAINQTQVQQQNLQYDLTNLRNESEAKRVVVYGTWLDDKDTSNVPLIIDQSED